MTPTMLRGALRQAAIELRVQLFSWNVLSWLLLPGIGLGVLLLLRDRRVMDTDLSLAQLGVPGILAFTLLSGAVMGAAGQLLTERDDGTLLRSKAVPGGMPSHLLGNVFILSVTTLLPTMVLLLLASLLVDGIAPTTAGSWSTLIWVSLLGMAACAPWGGVLGAILKDPVMMWITALVVYASMAVSGIFYPITALPDWLAALGKCLPTYWIGLGYRSALLPPEAAALEAGGSWQTGLTALVLTGWALVGLSVAPRALLRLARRQSGSQVAAARDRIMSRGY